MLGGGKLPFDVSVDGVDLEGDILLPALPGKDPVHVHVVVAGGGMASGREGTFAIDAAVVVPGSGLGSIGAHGFVSVDMDSPRTFSRIGIKADLSGQSRLLQENITLEAGAEAPNGQEKYTLGIGRGSRTLLAVLARRPGERGLIAGTWKVDLRDIDLAPFLPDHPLPSFSASGDGSFDAGADLSRIHALGAFDAVANRLGVLAPSLERLGQLSASARFDVTREGQSIHVDALSVALAGAHPVGTVKALQPFDLDEETGKLKLARPGEEWLDALIQGLPLAWLSGMTGRLTVAGGDASGEFVVRAEGGGINLRPKALLTAEDVSLQWAGRTLGRGLDVSIAMLADFGPGGWHAQWAPLTLDCAGKRLASVEAKASQTAGTDEPVAITGKWNCDLEALASQQAGPGLGWISGRSASGDFSASVGTSSEFDGKASLVGHAPGSSVAASVHADIDSDGGVAFQAPIKIASGPSATDLSAEGSWSSDESGTRIDVKLIGGSVTAEHLRLLAAPLAAAAGVSLPAALGASGRAQPAPIGARDRAPFWGDWTGRITVAFDRLKTQDREFEGVGGALDVDKSSIRLEGGRGGFQKHILTNVGGALSFDASAEYPYSLKAAVADSQIEAVSFFGEPKPDHEPVFEGRFNVSSTLKGSGISLDDLLGRTQMEFRLTSATGIVRLLKTNVAASVPEVPSPVSDTLGTVGSTVGSLFGVRNHSAAAGKNPINKSTEAVLNFTYQVSEILCDQITVEALRGSDGAIRLSSIEMTAPEEHLKGVGQIAYVKGLPLLRQALTLDLQLSTRGKAAELMTTAGLLSAKKDELGYTALSQRLHFGGTLEEIDGSQWNEMLVRAATQKPEGAKKAAD